MNSDRAFIRPEVKVVLFDHDDTLVQTFGPKSKQHKFIAKTYYGRALNDAEIKACWGMPLTEVCCTLYGTDDVEQAIALNKKHHEQYPKVLFPYTQTVLKQLHHAGKKIGIITATVRYSVEHDLRMHGFDMGILDYLQTEDDTKFHKPDPRVFDPTKQWLAEQGIKPDEVVYVGDSLRDMAAAVGAGFSFIGVATGLTTLQDFQKAGVRAIPDLRTISKSHTTSTAV